LWGTIVNASAILAGSLLGVLIRKGFSRKIMMTGIGILLSFTVIAALAGRMFGFYKPAAALVIGAAACIIWVIAGRLLRNGMPEAYSNIIMQGIGLSVVVIGISNSLETRNMLIVIMSLVVGGIIGQAVNIEHRLDALGSYAQKRLGGDENSTFSQGFVTASLIFCVGAMAIVGSLDAGIKGDYLTLYAKSMLDGITSIVLSSAMGIGVAFSALAVFVYQGAITLASNALSPILSEIVIAEMTAVGGVLIMGIGLSMLNIRKFNVGNLLPALFIPPVYFPLISFLSQLFESFSP